VPRRKGRWNTGSHGGSNWKSGKLFVGFCDVYAPCPKLSTKGETCPIRLFHPQCVLCSRASDRGSECAALDVRSREKPILSTRTIVALARKTKNTKMPIGTIARCACRERSGSLGERRVAGGMPECNLVRSKIDLISNVVPLVCLQLDLPLALAAHHPLQVGVRSTGLAVDPSVLQLSEMALEEADLVLVRRTGDIRGASLDREVVVYGALVDGSLCLRNELSSPHVLV
jgi:hypothetical protein